LDNPPTNALVGGKGKAKSPGMKYRHYAPKAPLVLIEGKTKEKVSKIQNLIDYYKKQKKRVGVMATEETKKFYQNANLVLVAGSRKNLEIVAKNLFKILREFDKRGVNIILAETFPEKGIGFAIMDRLKKAAQRSTST
jgi:L-threonylcarbamoyladenylate synthase